MSNSKSFKRIMSVILAVILIFSLSTAALATGDSAAASSSEVTSEASTDPATPTSPYSTIIQIAMFGGIIVIFYFLLIRPQKKKEKEAENMRKGIEVGDRIVTIGGIIGKVCNVKDDSITIETGADKVRLKLVKSAVSSVEKRDVSAEKNDKTESKKLGE